MRKHKSESNSELRLSPEAYEIIGRIPPWTIRNGITIIFLSIVTLIIGSAMVRYPDVQEFPAFVNSNNRSLSYRSPQYGAFTFHEALDGTFVKEGTVVGNVTYNGDTTFIVSPREGHIKFDFALSDGAFISQGDQLFKLDYKLGSCRAYIVVNVNDTSLIKKNGSVKLSLPPAGEQLDFLVTVNSGPLYFDMENVYYELKLPSNLEITTRDHLEKLKSTNAKAEIQQNSISILERILNNLKKQT
jgi:hypothetical protein